MNQSQGLTDQNKQFITMAIMMFVSVVSAIVISTILVSNIVRGDVAKAMSTNSSPVATTQSIGAPVGPVASVAGTTSCTAPTESSPDTNAPAGVVTSALPSGGSGGGGGGGTSGGSGLRLFGLGGGSISDSFNNSQSSNTYTTNNWTKSITKYDDSFNTTNSYNTKNSNNTKTIASNNTTTDNTNNSDNSTTTNTTNSTNNTNVNTTTNTTNTTDTTTTSTDSHDQTATAVGVLAGATNGQTN